MHLDSSLCGVVLSPAVQAPVKTSEEEGAAGVDAEGVAEFVEAAVVVAGVNDDVSAQQERGHGARHEGAVEHAATETGGFGTVVRGGGGAIEDPAETVGDEDNHEEPEGEPGQASATGRVRGGRRGGGGRRNIRRLHPAGS